MIRTRTVCVAIAALALAVGLAAPAVADPAAEPHRVEEWSGERGYVPVSDGTQLAYQVLFPDSERFGTGPFPLVVDYSGYRPADQFYDGVHRVFLRQGYAVAGVNVRGTGCSSGSFDFFDRTIGFDGYEMVEWLADRDWSNGDVALVGKSYPGISQLFVAATRPPSLRAIVPGHLLGDVYRDVAFPGGIENVVFAGGWSLASQPTPSLEQAAAGIERGDEQCAAAQAGRARSAIQQPFVHASARPFDDDWWHERGAYWAPEFFGAQHVITAPTMVVQSWQDEQVGSRALNMVETVMADTPLKIVTTNGDHGEYYGAAVLDEITRFLDIHLRGRIAPDDPAYPDEECRTKRNGKLKCRPIDPADARPEIWRHDDPGAHAAAVGRYMAEPDLTVLWETHRTESDPRTPSFVTRHETWPVPGTVATRLFLGPDGTLAAGPPTAGSSTTDYRYTPVLGSQGQGGSLADLDGSGFRRTPPEGSVAPFTTPPLAADLTVLGSGSVDLWVSSTAPDTDLEVMLTEVRPDGSETYVQKGHLRLSHAALDPARSTELRPFHTHRAEDVRVGVPGTVVQARVELLPTGHVFRSGSRLRLWVQSPGVASDLWGLLVNPTPAVNTIHHSTIHASSLSLETLPGFAPPTPLPACDAVRNQPCRPDPLG